MDIVLPLLAIVGWITGIWLMVRLIALADSMKLYFDSRIIDKDQ